MSASPAPDTAITVALTHTAGTATAAAGSTCAAGADYVVPATSATVAAAATSSSRITLTTCADGVVESNETFTLTVAAGTGYTVGTTSSATVTLLDGTLTVSRSASPNPVAEGDTVTVTATRSAEGPAATIPVTVTAGTAESGDHGTLTGITLTAGATTGTAKIPANQDADADDETFTVALNTASLPIPHAAGSTSSVEVTITDDDTPSVSLSASPNPVTEGGSVTIRATLAATLSTAVTIPLTLTAGTAEGGDYGALASITVAAGATSGTGTISANQDADNEHETFTVALGSLPSPLIAGSPSSVEVTITDDDIPSVTLSASPNPVGEGSDVTVTATLSKAHTADATIPLTLTAGTAESGDYGALASITVSAGATSGTGTIATNHDTDDQHETFTVALGSLPAPLIAGSPSSVEVTITDAGALDATLTASPLRPEEGRTATLTATLSRPAPAGGITAYFWTPGGTASRGGDFTLEPAPPGNRVDRTADIVIAEGNRIAQARVVIVADDEEEEDETIVMTVIGPWTGEAPEITLTIPANGASEPPLTLSASPRRPREGSRATLTATLRDPAPAGGVTVTFFANGVGGSPATAGLDYTLAPPHPSGSTNLTADIVIPEGSRGATATLSVLEDGEPEGDELIEIGVATTPSTYTVPVDTLAIPGNDTYAPEVWLGAYPNPVGEGDTVTVTAFLSGALDRAVTVPVRTVRGTSESGDHGTLSGIRIEAGEKAGDGRIEARQDSDGDDETFSVVLRGLPASLRAGDPDSVEVTIEDDDEPAPAVRLEAYPNPVAEGDTVTVTAFLTEAFDRAVTIPVRTVRGTSESGDHGTLSSIRIAAGEASGEGRIRTFRDSDGDDETFTVRLGGNLPSPLHAGSPAAVGITISDNGGGTAPGVPRNLRVTAGDARLDLTWTAPSSGAPTDYTVEYRERGASDWTALSEPDYTDTVAAIEGLENGTRYDVRVQAWNERGPGAWATGSGTPTSGQGSNANLRALTVRASAGENGTYRTLALVPSFRQSVTTYATATAPAATTHVKLTPTAADADATIIVDAHEVASGSASPAIDVGHGSVIWVSVISEDQNAYKEYSIEVRVARASGDAAGRVTAGVDAALAVVGTLSPDDAAGALLGERSLGGERLEALDRLGNANGRYDLGDLLAWIERCRSGGARCGEPPGATPPASQAALPGAVAAAAKRPGRRVPGRKRTRRRRRPRTGVFAVLLAAGLWSCDGAGVVGVPSAADMPEPGYLTVEWTARAAGPAVAGALVEIDGPQVGDARALGGLELYAGEEGRGPRRFVVAGNMRNGPALEFRVADLREARLYTIRVVEVAGADHRLLDADRYRAGIASN